MVGYATYRMHKKMKKKLGKKVKFFSPSHGMNMYGGGGGGFGSPHFGGGGGFGSPHYGGTSSSSGFGKSGFKLGKKIIGAAIKLTIAKYALKYGFKAAKLYFEYKLGRSLSDHMIEKFIGRYHRQRTRELFRQNRRMATDKKNFKLDNITIGEDCARECRGDNLTCFFTFHIHLYQTLSRACYDCPNTKADCRRPECIVGSGRRKLISAVNRMSPGPLIEVCKGDKVLVQVHNELPSSGVTLHFRGQSYLGNPFMEGTPGVTQHPVASGEIFTYSFTADKSGTHFWHANTGVMRSDGLFGPFVVKELVDVHGSSYDIDAANQTIMVSEDFLKRGEEQLIHLSQKQGKIDVYSLLINGNGLKMDEASADIHGSNMTYARINVLAGKKNRLRIVSAVSSNCPFTFRILGQKLSIIYLDGSPVTQKEVETLLVYPGERFDAILQAPPVGQNWIEVKGKLDCDGHTQYAVLESAEAFPMLIDVNSTKVETLPNENPRLADSKYNTLTEVSAFCNSSDVVCSRNLTSTLALPKAVLNPNMSLYLSLTSRKIHNEHFYSLLHYDVASIPVEEQTPTWQINNLTLILPPDPLLVNEDPLSNAVCSAAGVRRAHCVEIFCECLHLLEMPLGSVVDVVLINEGASNSLEPQTMYLHGHNFWVISQSKEFLYSNESLDNNTSPYMDRMKIIIRDAEELLIKDVENPIMMNSITVPEAGYAVIRFEAKNPGYWLLESSSIFKSINGMGVVFKVGEVTDLPKNPNKQSRCSMK